MQVSCKGKLGLKWELNGGNASWEENKSIERGIKWLRWTRSTAQRTNCALKKDSTEHNGKFH